MTPFVGRHFNFEQFKVCQRSDSCCSMFGLLSVGRFVRGVICVVLCLVCCLLEGLSEE